MSDARRLGALPAGQMLNRLRVKSTPRLHARFFLIGSVGTFLFWIVHQHERDHRTAVVLKLAIVGVGLAAILRPFLSLMR